MNKMGSGNPCKVAFVGAGYMASEHIKAFRDIPGVELSGIFSRTSSRAEALAKEFGIGIVCNSVSELHEKTRADLVVVSVPELSVRAVAEECFRYPWTSLIEKPAGYNVEQAEAIAGAAQAAGRRAYVALNRRHYSSTRTVLSDLASNAGQRLIHVQDQADLIAAAQSGQPQLVLENWMYANSIHVIDYLTMLGRGPVTEVQQLVRWNPDSPGFVAAKILFESGDVALYQAIWNGPGPWALSVTTQAKRWEIRPLEQASFQLNGQRKLEPVASHAWDQQFKPGLRRQAELAVLAAMGEAAPELPTLEEALKSMRLAQAIYKVK
jgi:predicted dehydrogenase